MKTKSILLCLVFAFCANTCITVCSQPVSTRDSLALVDLYNSTDGPNWFDNTNWLNGPVRIWTGITVTGTRVTAINLQENNLDGSIPASIGNLVHLTTLDLCCNQLSGGIPSSIGNLVNLTSLRLYWNQLSGGIPSSIGNLVNLTYFDLGSNQLSGSIPSSIGNLANLEGLNLGNNQLSGTIPSSIGKLVNLIFLELYNNQLSGSIPSSIGNLGIQILNLFNNQLSGSIPSSIGNLYGLGYLYLSNNHLSGGIPSSLGNLVYLGELVLSNNQLSGSIPSSIGNLTGLYYLSLNDNQLSGIIPSSLGNLENLSQLYLNNNQLSGSIPSSLGNLVNLEGLALDNNQLSGSIPSSLANLVKRNFYYLGLSHNRFTFSGMELIAQTFIAATYAPQARIPVHQNGNALSVSAGGKLSHNTYKWFRCEKTGNTLISTITGDSVFHPSQSGIYDVKVTNSVATQLTLTSKTIKYFAPSQFVESATPSSENALQQNDKTNLFLVYPNPAKNTLYIKTNGNTSFSLLNQSGQTLLTTNINGKGSINVSGMAAGLYYLKNNSSGGVLKVVIAR